MNPNDRRRDEFIPIESTDHQRIGGLTRLLTPNIDAAEALARWRNDNREWFFDSREVTPESTLAWMERVTSNPAVSLFLIETEGGRFVGTYNYTILDNETVRLDNLIRGGYGAHKALIYGVEVALLGYLFYELGATRVVTETFTDNLRVNRLLASVGFLVQETRIYPIPSISPVARQYHVWQNALPQYQAATQTTPEDRYIRIPEWAK